MFPLISFGRCDEEEANRCLRSWGHADGSIAKRPFGKQAFALRLLSDPISVAVSASTPRPTCGPYERKQVVELARLCSHPAYSWATRVCLRLWREMAPAEWGNAYWPVIACVSYHDAIRHSGNVYRFDGWRVVAENRAKTSGPRGGHQARKTSKANRVWAWELP